jgi:hypothetical protein
MSQVWNGHDPRIEPFSGEGWPTRRNKQYETFEKCSFLLKVKEGENFNHRNTLSISRINPPKYGGGLTHQSSVAG